MKITKELSGGHLTMASQQLSVEEKTNQGLTSIFGPISSDGIYREVGVDVAGADDSHLNLILFHLSTKTIKECLGCMFRGRICKGLWPEMQVRERVWDRPTYSFPFICLYLKTDITISDYSIMAMFIS